MLPLPSSSSTRRLKRASCGHQRCPMSAKVWKCHGKIDLVLLLDGSGSMGSSGWYMEKVFANKLVSAFEGQNTSVSIIVFGGPKTWDDYRTCNGPNASTVDQEKVCGIKMVQHFTNDTAQTKKTISTLKWPRGSTFTAKAFQMASSELQLGRKDATRVVVTMTDGMPISVHSTDIAAAKLRRQARLMIGAVRLTRKSLGRMTSWASAPKRDNVMRISRFQEMMKTQTVNKFLRDMCTTLEA